ncbi:hypothetical protein HDZ31DRAFT_81035 [Schizophyllum fasciatum]
MNCYDTLEERAAKLIGTERRRSPWAPSSCEEAKLLRCLAKDIEECLPQLSSDISQAVAELRALEDAVRSAQHRVQTLINQRRRLAKQRKICATIAVAYIRRLPIEIMTMIFNLVLDPLYPFYARELGSIMLTCSHWHSIALSTPMLWSTMRLCWYKPTGFLASLSEVPDNRLVQKQLEYSADAPLAIHLNVISGFKSDIHSSVTLKSVLQQSHRWNTVSICIRDTDFSLNVPNLAFPGLERLILNTGELASGAPQLKCATIRCLACPSWNILRPRSWTLTSLCLASVAIPISINVLEQCGQSLESLALRACVSDAQDTRHHQPICLPALSNLAIASDDFSRRLCPLLDVPEVVDSGPFILEMVRRSSATVTWLEIRGGGVAVQCVLQLMGGLPDVIDVYFDADQSHEYLDEQFFAKLTPSADNVHCPLPKLRCISLVISVAENPESIPCEAVIDMLNELRTVDQVVNGQLYPALKERIVMHNPGDHIFANYDSEDDDASFVPSEIDSNSDTDYSSDASLDGSESEGEDD